MLHLIVDITIVQYDLYADFETWKEDLEKSNDSWFVRATGQKELVSGAKHYYYCNRSGHFISKGTGLRHLKTQGTSKINSHCTSSLTVSHEDGEYIKVQVCYTHYGHKVFIGHLRIPHTDRMAVASQLAQGVEVQYILDRIRDNISNTFKRIHLLTRKDINNIEKSYGLKGAQKHKDDATSVHLWVKEMESLKNNSPVILYKPQGAIQPNDCNDVCVEDFVLGIQTPLQAEIMKRFGKMSSVRTRHMVLTDMT